VTPDYALRIRARSGTTTSQTAETPGRGAEYCDGARGETHHWCRGEGTTSVLKSSSVTTVDSATWNDPGTAEDVWHVRRFVGGAEAMRLREAEPTPPDDEHLARLLAAVIVADLRSFPPDDACDIIAIEVKSPSSGSAA
jgi:hypothetical protein